MCWAEEPLVSLVADSEDLACYGAAGLARQEEFRMAINRDGWRDRLAAECAAVLGRLADIRAFAEVTPSIFEHSLGR